MTDVAENAWRLKCAFWRCTWVFAGVLLACSPKGDSSAQGQAEERGQTDEDPGDEQDPGNAQDLGDGQERPDEPEAAPSDPSCPAALPWELSALTPEPTAGAVLFTPRSCTFTAPFELSLASKAAGESVRYTLDGSAPTLNSSLYTVPVTITASTVIRAVALSADGGVSGTSSAAYLRLAEDSADFGSNLPLTVIHVPGGASTAESDEYAVASVLTFDVPLNGRVSLLGEASFHSRAGIKLRGESSRGFPQKSYSVELWSAEADTGAEKVFLGMPAAEDWAIIAPSVMDRSLIRNSLAFAMSRAIGRYAPRTRMTEVFLAGAADDVSAADYVGVYTAAERVKRGENRVNVSKLSATDIVEPNVSGGYIFRIDRASDFSADGQAFEWVYPKRATMAEPARVPQVQYLTKYIDELAATLEMASLLNPNTGKSFRDYVDVGSFIDHNLLIALTKNVDGLRLSTNFFKERGQPLSAGPIWDFDRALGTPYDDRAIEPEEWNAGGGAHPLEERWYGRMFSNQDFETQYWQRFDRMTCKALSTQSLLAMVDALSLPLAEAQVRHFQRWGEIPPANGAHAEEIRILKVWLARRVAWLTAQRPLLPSPAPQQGDE